MNKFLFFAQLLFIYGVSSKPYSTPEECLIELKCNGEVNCVAHCYNVPAPDTSSVTKTADCQNSCLAKYPNNVASDWANLNQCYLDCVQNNYFNPPASAPAAPSAPTAPTTQNTAPEANAPQTNAPQTNSSETTAQESNAPQTNTPADNKTNAPANKTPSITSGDANQNTPLINNNNNNSTLANKTNSTLTDTKKNNTLSSGKPINATDKIPSVIVDSDSSFIPGYSFNQIFMTIAVMLFVFLAFN